MKKIETIDGFEIYFEALPEDLALSDIFDDSVTNIKRLASDIDAGRKAYFCAKVTANKNGIELATDYLGACCYKSEDEFYIKYHNDYFLDMANNVIAEAKQAVINLNK